MLEAGTQTLLAKVLRRESLSVLQYAGQAFPWARSNEHGAVAEISRLWQEDRACLGELTRFLHRQRIRPPFIGAFPTSFTTLNFIGLDFLLAKLLEDQKRAVADLERDCTATTEPEAREQLQKLLDVKKKHLPILERLTSAPSQPAA